MHAMTQEQLPPARDAPDESPPAPGTPMTTVMWIHDGPVCVTVVDTPLRVPCNACQCAACRTHQPDLAALYY